MKLKEAVYNLRYELDEINKNIAECRKNGVNSACVYVFLLNKKETIETILQALEEKDQRISELEKMVDLMAEQLNGCVIWNIEKDEPIILNGENEVKKYFIDKAKEG